MIHGNNSQEVMSNTLGIIPAHPESPLTVAITHYKGLVHYMSITLILTDISATCQAIQYRGDAIQTRLEEASIEVALQNTTHLFQINYCPYNNMQ